MTTDATPPTAEQEAMREIERTHATLRSAQDAINKLAELDAVLAEMYRQVCLSGERPYVTFSDDLDQAIAIVKTLRRP